MFIIKDKLEGNVDVKILDKSQMFKVLEWDNGVQLVCDLRGDSGVKLFHQVLWCGGELTLAKAGALYEYSGDGNVFLQVIPDSIKLVELREFGLVSKVHSHALLAVPSEYDVEQPDADGIVAVSGTGVLPLRTPYKDRELITVTISDDDTIMVPSSGLVCWSSTLLVEKLGDGMEGMCRLSGEGSVLFGKGH